MKISTVGQALRSRGSGIGLRLSGHAVWKYPSISTSAAYTSADTSSKPHTASSGRSQ